MTSTFLLSRPNRYCTITKPPVLSPQFHNALAYASALHETQRRKGSHIPYVAHLLAVTSIVLEAGGSEDEAIAAMLHDGPEDRGGVETLDEIQSRFGETVAAIVAGCSDTFETPKPPWEERKRRYREHLKTAGRSVLLVSAADKLHNSRATLRDLKVEGPSVWARFSATREQTLENYLSLIDVYAAGAGDPRRNALVDELRVIVAEMSASIYEPCQTN
jgi:(p)ppGpp synthase/HD superfamily hydrolase